MKNEYIEFDNNLKTQCNDDKEYFRLHYIEYHRMHELFGIYENNIGCCNYPYGTFKLPNNMSKEDAYKVISYLRNYIRDDLKLIPNSLEEMDYLDKVLHLDRFGFEFVNNVNPENINELYIVDGRVKLFEDSEEYNKYFDWEVNDVSYNDVCDIYSALGLKFSNPVSDKETKKEIVKKNLKKHKMYKSIMKIDFFNARPLGYARELESDMILLNMYGYSFDDYMRLCEEYSRDEALNMILKKKKN